MEGPLETWIMNTLSRRILSIAVVAVCWLILAVSALEAEPADRKFIINYDLVMSPRDGDWGAYNIRHVGMPFPDSHEMRGGDLAETEYIFTISDIDGKHGKLMIEFYQYESRQRSGDPISEFVTEVDFELGAPAQLLATLGEYSIDLAFNIGER